MPTDVPGNSASYPVNIRTPSDSDSPLASGQLRTALTDLADRTAYLKVSPGLITSVGQTGVLAPATTTSSTYSDVLGSSTVFTVGAVGDRIEIRVKLRINPGANKGYARVYWYNPDATTVVVGESLVSALVASDDNHLTIDIHRTATQAGLHNLYVQHANGNNSTLITTEIYSVLVKVYRP